MLTHNLSTHNLSPHNLLTHNLSTHNLSPLTHTHNSLTCHHLLTHTTRSHTTSPHTTCPHTTCPHTTSLHTTCHHNNYSHTHNLSWHLATSASALRDRHGTWRHRPSLCVAGMALGDMDHHLVWQARHLWHSAGSGGALGSQLTPWAARLLTWQAWRLATSTVTLRGRRGTWQHGRSLCMAGMALGDMDRHFAWQAWPLWHWAGSGGALGSQLAPWSPRLFAWQRGAWRHRPSLCVAGVALGDIHAASESSLSNTTLSHTHTTLSRIIFHTRLSHMQLRPHIFATRNFATHTQLCRAQLFHTQLCHKQLCHTQLCHTQLFHTQLCHRQICHTQLFHTQLCHRQSFTTTFSHSHNFLSRTTFCHIQSFTHIFVTDNSFTHNFVTGNLSHNPSHTTVKIIDPPPSPLSFLLFPCCFSHFSDYWMKLTCGVIRPFNYQYRSTLSHFL